MYAGATIEICALEKFVHLAGVPAPPLSLVSIDLPDDPGLLLQPQFSTLPPNWSELPAPASAQEFGRAWLMAAKQLVLLLPSAIVPEARTAMINPLHPRYRELKLKIVRDFSFDARMFKPGMDLRLHAARGREAKRSVREPRAAPGWTSSSRAAAALPLRAGF